MSQPRYDLYFKGELIDGFFVDFVKSDLQTLFKADQAYVDRLFIGTELAIKKSVDKATAIKYQQAFKKAGAKLIVRPHQDNKVARPRDTQTNTHAQSDKNKVDTNQLTTVLGAVAGEGEPSLNEPPQPKIKAPDMIPSWSLLEPGASLTEPDNTPETSVKAPELTLANIGEDLLTTKALEATPPTPNIDSLSLAAPGAVIETLTETQMTPSIDTSHITLE